MLVAVEIDRIVIEGRAPIWRRGMALHHLHGSPAAAIAFPDPRLGAGVGSGRCGGCDAGAAFEGKIKE